MLPQHASKQKEVISPIEFILLALSFIAVLIFLFPKQNLEEQVLDETSNYDLTAIYLQNFIKLKPKDTHLLFAMSQTLYDKQHPELSKQLLKVLENNPDESIKIKATLQHLQQNNLEMAENITKERKEQIRKENNDLLAFVAQKPIQDAKNNEVLYASALALKQKRLALMFNVNLLKDTTHPKYLYWLKNAHYLAQELQEKQLDQNLLKHLILEDKKQEDVWLGILLTELAPDEDIQLLAQELHLSDAATAKLYTLKNQSMKAAHIYQDLLEKAPSLEEKKVWINKIITIFQANNQTLQAASLVKRYEDLFLHDQTMTKRFLKLYFAANRANYAKELSLKILHNRRQK